MKKAEVVLIKPQSREIEYRIIEDSTGAVLRHGDVVLIPDTVDLATATGADHETRATSDADAKGLLAEPTP